MPPTDNICSATLKRYLKVSGDRETSHVRCAATHWVRERVSASSVRLVAVSGCECDRRPSLVGYVNGAASEAAACAERAAVSSNFRGQRKAMSSARWAVHLIAGRLCTLQPPEP